MLERECYTCVQVCGTRGHSGLLLLVGRAFLKGLSSSDFIPLMAVSKEPHLKYGGNYSQVALPANAGDSSSIPGSERSPGEGNSNPLQYSCQNNPVNRGAWWVTVYGVAKSQT